jgi:hypothetical protein
MKRKFKKNILKNNKIQKKKKSPKKKIKKYNLKCHLPSISVQVLSQIKQLIHQTN